MIDPTKKKAAPKAAAPVAAPAAAPVAAPVVEDKREEIKINDRVTFSHHSWFLN